MTDSDLIERLRAECDHWPRTSTLDPLLREAADALEAAREDAERYRWLRKGVPRSRSDGGQPGATNTGLTPCFCGVTTPPQR